MKFKIVTLCLLMAGACAERKEVSEPVARSADYEEYLTLSFEEEINNLEEELKFWSGKVDVEPKGFIYHEKLGQASLKLFEKTGDISYLNNAYHYFDLAEELTSGKRKAQNLLALSSLSIKKHAFEEAHQFAVLARTLTDEKFGPLLMQFDAEMELGNYVRAEGILKRNRRMDSFDFLVRWSKLKDHQGYLDSAIFYMEKAQKLVRNEDSPRAISAEANLGDLYGHAGNIQESYEKYLSVLERDPSYSYALKGIAWIVYSNDGDEQEAARILKAIDRRTLLPDVFLDLAEASGSSRADLISAFVQEAKREEYGGMYNKYLVQIMAEEFSDFESALRIARKEADTRPTPGVYDILAWTHYLNGENEKAVEIYQSQVEGLTEEPEVLYHMGVVYHQSGRKEGKKLLRKALEASYELGPKVTSEIKRHIQG